MREVRGLRERVESQNCHIATLERQLRSLAGNHRARSCFGAGARTGRGAKALARDAGGTDAGAGSGLLADARRG